MGNINIPRVLLGGVLAGVVLNIGELVNGLLAGQALAAHIEALGIPEPQVAEAVLLLLSTFVYGIVMIWLYAAIRPRFGAGPKTALIAGFIMWLISPFLGGVQLVTMGFLPTGIQSVIGIAWSLVQYLAAAAAGAWVYSEREA